MDNMMDLYWWKKEPNFGDALNADLFSKLMGVESVRWVPAKKCDAIFIGSILEHFYLQQEPGFKDLWRRYFRRCVHVWGQGF